MRERDIYPQDCPRTVRSRRNRFGNTELACSPKYHGAKTAYWAVGRQTGNYAVVVAKSPSRYAPVAWVYECRAKIRMYLDPAPARQPWRPTPPAPTGRPQKLLYSFFSSVASSDDDPACRNSNLDSGKTRCVACRYSQTPPLTFELPRGCVAWGLTTCLLRSSSYFNTRHSSANRCVGQTLTHSSDNPNTAEVTSARNL